MSEHEDSSLIDPLESASPKMDILEWGDVRVSQPLERMVLSQSFTARPAQPMSTQQGATELASDNSKNVHASGSLQSLPSLDSNLSSNCPSLPSQSHSWPRSTTSTRKSRDSTVRLRHSLKHSSDGGDVSSLPTKTSDDNLSSTYSIQSTLHSDIAVDLTDPVVTVEANPYMIRIIWVMASLAFVACGAGIALVLHSLLQSSETQPVTEEAQSDDPREVFNLDLDMDQ